MNKIEIIYYLSIFILISLDIRIISTKNINNKLEKLLYEAILKNKNKIKYFYHISLKYLLLFFFIFYTGYLPIFLMLFIIYNTFTNLTLGEILNKTSIAYNSGEIKSFNSFKHFLNYNLKLNDTFILNLENSKNNLYINNYLYFLICIIDFQLILSNT